MQTPTTRNEDYGFFGTIALDLGSDFAEDFWEAAVETVAERSGVQNLEVVRDYLDSRAGRHLADLVISRYTSGFSMRMAVTWAVNREAEQTVHRIDRSMFPRMPREFIGRGARLKAALHHFAAESALEQ